MLALLLFLSLLLFSRVGRLRGYGVRLAAMTAFGVFGATLALGTELLSLFSAVTFGGLILFWGIVVLVGAVLSIKMKAVTAGGEDRERKQWPRTSLVAIAGMLLFFGTLSWIAWSFAPNNFDSMVYHMARVVPWEQDGNVQHYATHSERQIYMSP
jgi:hypothetical protein